ncbi:MAG TPA: hypothetical protein ENK18_05615 [Deltaproteobacteria bacterium]|nr:hypothetical protein [Deltaproteobacteria bacterium]
MRTSLITLVAIGCSTHTTIDDKSEPCTSEIPYDGIDQDCDGVDLADVDGDGVDALQAGGADCDDEDASIFPAASEVPYDGIDQDCSGSDLVDVDGDGVRGEPAGGDDCDDEAASTYPGAFDLVGDGVDQDCDGVDGVDADGDGHASTESGGADCRDDDDAIFPGAEDAPYDGIDSDCDRLCDYDADGDGFVLDGHVVEDNRGCDADPTPNEISYAYDCDDTNAAATDNFLRNTVPAAGDVGVFNLSPIRAQLSREEPGATLVVTDPRGVVVPGTTTWLGRDLAFTPSSFLDPLTTFQADLSWSCGSETWSFESADIDDPVDPVTLDGSTYSIDLTSGTWIEPPGVGPLIPLLIGDLEWLMGVETVNAQTIDWLQAPGDGLGGQDLCAETNALPAADFSNNPLFSIGPADINLDVLGVLTVLEGAFMGGTIRGDYGALEGLSVSGTLDTRPWVDAIVPGGSDDSVCVLFATFGVSCDPCADGSGTYCLDVVVDSFDAPLIPGVSMVPRSSAEIAADPTCSP